MILYGTPFFLSLAFSLGIILLLLLLPLFSGRIWRQGARHNRKTALSRLGGVAIIASFLVTVILDPHLVITKEIFGLLLGSLLILFFGLVDDLSPQHWKAQLFFQIALGSLMFLFGIRILSLWIPGNETLFFTGGFLLIPSLLLFLGWLLLVLNAMNWLDGLDGLAGGVAVLSLVTIFLLTLKPEVNQPPIAILALAGAGATLGFLLFNYWPARILAGTTGALFLGFLISVLAVIAGTKIATALMVLSLPIADALWVIIDRFRHKRSIFEADTAHLHYRLRSLGWSEKRIGVFFYGITAIIALLALSTSLIGKFIAILSVFVLLFFVLIFVAWKTRLKNTAEAA